jgi:putative transcriptional regulator
MEVNVLNKINQHRTKKGLTQEELAQAVGVTRQTIISIEKGNYTPSVSLALRFAEVFNTKVESIFFLEYEK